MGKSLPGTTNPLAFVAAPAAAPFVPLLAKLAIILGLSVKAALTFKERQGELKKQDSP